jgi:ABC-2 type transport system permease protein
MTYLQRTLGNNYKWLYILQYSFKISTTYRISALIWMLVKILTMFGTILIWYVNIQSGSNLFDFKTIFTYYGSGVHWNVSQMITKGVISKYLIVPSDPKVRLILEDFGWWFFQNIAEVVMIIVIAFFGREYLNSFDFGNLILYILCGLLGYILSILFGFILGCMSFFLTDAHGVMDIHTQSIFFLSGKAIPLNIISFLAPLTFLPFSFSFYHPVQLYLGRYSTIETVHIFLGGIIWCFGLWLTARIIFKFGLKKNEAVGL